MKIGVCISRTPETTAKISFTNQDTALNTDGVNFIMNPYDEWYALVRAIELKESNGTGEVILIHVGEQDGDPIIRKGLAIGADRAIRYDLNPTTSHEVAVHIADAVKREHIDILFLGKETIDYNGAEVGAMVAAHIEWPFISFVNHMSMEGDTATLTREIEGGEEIVQVTLPFVLSASKGLAEQRIPNMRGIMMSKRKPIDVIEPLTVQKQQETLTFKLPDQKSGVTMVDPDNMEELVRLLHEEAKVI